MEKLDGLAKAFADAIASHGKNDDLLNLFAAVKFTEPFSSLRPHAK